MTMNKTWEMAVVRRAYAKQILAIAGVRDARLEAAYAQTSREHYLGPGPWQIHRWWCGYVATPDDDPVYLYTNDVFAIDVTQQLNNGEPAFHACLIAQASPRAGEHVVHVGAGVGYYTAILAQLVGPAGRVTAFELDATLAGRAAVNLAPLANVEVVQGDGTTLAFDPADVIYVNAGATRPATAWLDGLTEGGRLIVPLTTEHGFTAKRTMEQVARSGAVFRIERRGTDYFARWISTVAVFPCAGARDAAAEAALSAALEKGRWQEVTRLYRHEEVAEELCWLRAPGWSLAYR